MERLRQLSGEVFQIAPMTLYPTLHRLESSGTAGGRPQDVGRSTREGLPADRGRPGTGWGDDTGWKLLSKRRRPDCPASARDADGRRRSNRRCCRTRIEPARSSTPPPPPSRAGRSAATSSTTWTFPAARSDSRWATSPARGPPAALLAALMQGSLAAQAHSSDGPAATITAVNTAVVRRGIQGRFVHALLRARCCPTAASRTATPATIPPILVSPNAGVRRLEDRRHGARRVRRRGRSRRARWRLRPGDCLVLFSDGISEAMNDAGRRVRRRPAHRLPDRPHGLRSGGPVWTTSSPARGDSSPPSPQHDDMTAMVVSYRPPAGMDDGSRGRIPPASMTSVAGCPAKLRRCRSGAPRSRRASARIGTRPEPATPVQPTPSCPCLPRGTVPQYTVTERFGNHRGNHRDDRTVRTLHGDG